jgi:CheY-like chemotaxis protein
MPTPRVVVADDHDETRALIARLLAPEFDVVATVDDGRAAVEACRTLRPDLIVLDIAMPRLNGLEATVIIRDLPGAPRIVLCTAHDDAEFSTAACELGVSALVPKRKMLVDLVPAVRRALHFHAVCFYEDAQSLSRTVAGFIAQGFIAGDAAIVIATPTHRAAIQEELTAIDVDPQKRIAQGELLILDAQEVMDSFMVGGLPDEGRFHDHTLKPIMDRVAGRRRPHVRAYGEMVDVLWRNGQEAAAVSLEMLWNQVIASGNCSLVCGYAAAHVGSGAGFEAIGHQHSHVVGEGRT